MPMPYTPLTTPSSMGWNQPYWDQTSRDLQTRNLKLAMGLGDKANLPQDVLYSIYGINQDPIAKLSALFTQSGSQVQQPSYRQPTQYEGMSKYMPEIMDSFNQKPANPFGQYLSDLLGRQK